MPKLPYLKNRAMKTGFGFGTGRKGEREEWPVGYPAFNEYHCRQKQHSNNEGNYNVGGCEYMKCVSIICYCKDD
jgi:hypothetical protein